MDKQSFDTMMGMLQESTKVMEKISTFLDNEQMPTQQVIVAMLYMAFSQALEELPREAVVTMSGSLLAFADKIRKLEAAEAKEQEAKAEQEAV